MAKYGVVLCILLWCLEPASARESAQVVRACHQNGFTTISTVITIIRAHIP